MEVKLLCKVLYVISKKSFALFLKDISWSLKISSSIEMFARGCMVRENFKYLITTKVTAEWSNFRKTQASLHYINRKRKEVYFQGPDVPPFNPETWIELCILWLSGAIACRHLYTKRCCEGKRGILFCEKVTPWKTWCSSLEMMRNISVDIR